MYVKPLVIVYVPTELVMATFTVPATCAGAATTSWEAVLERIVPAAAPKVTYVTEFRFVPSMLTPPAPATEPLLVRMALTMGERSYLYQFVTYVGCLSPFVTTT